MPLPFRRPLGAALLCSCSLAALAQAAVQAPAPEALSAPAEPSAWERVGTVVNDFTAAVGDMEAWEERGYWRLVASPYAPHFRPSEEHQPVWAIGVERQRLDDWLAGASFFSNSFGQPSGYVYVGRRYPALFDVEPLFFQWSAGLMYGYVGKYESKVPANVNGFSPGALISLGWQFNRQISMAVHALGDAGLMFQFGFDLR